MAQQKGNGGGLQEFVDGVLTSKYAVSAIVVDAGFDLDTEMDASKEAVERLLQLIQPMMYQIEATDGTEILVNAQDETSYTGVGDNGSFTTSADHTATDLVTLSDGTVITVDALSVTDRVTITAQDETAYTGAGALGTFVGGTGHAASDIITMSDGSTITVDLVNTGVVTEFTVDSSTATAGTVSGVALTQTSTTGGGVVFTYTPGVDNISGSVTEFTVASGGSATPGVVAVALTFASSDGTGTAFTLTPGGTNIAGGGGIIYAVVDAGQLDAASLQVQIRAIGTDLENGKDFSSATVALGTSMVVS